MLHALRFLLFCGLALPFPSYSTTVIPFENLAQLYLASDEVILARAGTPNEIDNNDFNHSHCDFTVLLALKGILPADKLIAIHPLSYLDEWGQFNVAGDFIPKKNQIYLLFLNKYGNNWRPMMLSYYVFEQSSVKENGVVVFYLKPVVESLDIGSFPRPDGKIPEPLVTYKRDPLLQMLQQYNSDSALPWNTDGIQEPPGHNPAATDRAIPVGCDFDMGSGLSRWKNPLINLYYDITLAPGDATERFASVRATLHTAYPGLNLINAGPTDFTPDCNDNAVAGNDFVAFCNNSLNGTQSDLLFFEDPCNQIANLVNCAGVLGIGGSYTLSSTHVYKSDTWKDAAWGYVVINNGVHECLTSANYERLLLHEITHTFKMDHLNATLYPNNNMNPSCCNAINTKDRECMNYVYSIALPVELTSFDLMETAQVINIRWSTAQETDNAYFMVEKSSDGLQFEPLATVEAGNSTLPATYEIKDAQPFEGRNYYRLIQQDLDGTRNQLGMRTINFKGHGVHYIIAPNPASDNSVTLLMSEGERKVESLQLLDPNGRVTRYEWSSIAAGGNSLELGIANLPPGIYWLNIREENRSEMVKFVRN